MKKVLSALLGLSLVTPAYAHTQEQLDPEIVEILEETTLKQIARKTKRFSATLWQEVEDGELTFSLEQTNKKLNASYTPDNNKITIECDNTLNCNTDAVEHELAHHVWADLNKEQQTAATESLFERLNQPDAAEFNERLSQMQTDHWRVFTIASKSSELVDCARLVGEVRYAQGYAKVLDKLDQPGAAKDLRDLVKMAKESYASCSPTKLRKAHKASTEANETAQCLQERKMAIYHGGQATVCPDVDLKEFPLDTASKDHNTSVGKLSNQVSNYGQLIIDELWENKPEAALAFSDVQMSYQAFSMRATFQQLKGTLNQSIMIIKGVHDDLVDEQFAAAVDSLYDLYKGPITMAPMKMSLTEPLLDTLEKMEYKGEKIFAKQVNLYRSEVLGQGRVPINYSTNSSNRP